MIVNLIKDEVKTIDRISDAYEINTDSGTYFADVVILSTGNNLQDNVLKIDTNKRYVNDLYFEFNRIMQEIKPSMRNILILGSSLSSVDVILTLQKLGFAGAIHCIST